MERPEINFDSIEEFRKSKFKSDPDAQNWIDAGSPLLWVKVEVDGDATLYHDHAYGGMKLVVRDKQATCAAKHKLVDCNGVLGVDKGYFNLDKGIWR